MNDSKSTVEELRRLVLRQEARQQLSDLIANYCMAVDYRDLEALADLYTSDAEFEGAAGKAEETGRIGGYHWQGLGPAQTRLMDKTAKIAKQDRRRNRVHAPLPIRHGNT